MAEWGAVEAAGLAAVEAVREGALLPQRGHRRDHIHMSSNGRTTRKGGGQYLENSCSPPMSVS